MVYLFISIFQIYAFTKGKHWCKWGSTAVLLLKSNRRSWTVHPHFRIRISNLHEYVQMVKRALAICSTLLWILNLCFLTQPSEEEEIVDLMLMKIYSLFGIKRKHAKDTRESDVSGGCGLAQNNSRNILSTSPDANIFQMSEKYVNL